jgi:hypothetical protein
MSDRTKLHGGVIISYERHSHGVVELLTARLRNRIGLTHYTHAYEIDLAHPHDFMIVLSLRDLKEVVRFFYLKDRPTPLIVHIDTPDVLSQIDYAAQFPHVDVAPVEQANISADPDVTLKLNLFKTIIEHLEASATR